MTSIYDAQEKLYQAVDAYCTASKEAGKQKKPISESYWNAVVIAWKRVKELKGE